MEQAIRWKDGARCAVMLSFDVDGETVWIYRDPALAARPLHMGMGAYGPKTAMPRILKFLDRYELKIGFFIPGWIIEHCGGRMRLIATIEDPRVIRRILARNLSTALAETQRPSLIVVDSHIAYGSPHKQDTSGAHGEPLGEEEVRLTKERYGWPPDAQFLVPEEVRRHMGEAVERGRRWQFEWEARLEAYRKAYPELAAEWDLLQAGELPRGWDRELPSFLADAEGIAGRDASAEILNAIARRVPWLIGGSADLTPSTKTRIKDGGDFQREDCAGRNLHFGVREHAMGAILNGMALAKLRPYGSGFLIFSDYARPTLRLAAMMELPVIHIFTHDSIGVGEDGPTHQPIEHLASLRAIPHLVVLRPADANECAEAWRFIMDLSRRPEALRHSPVALILSRQKLPTLDRARYAPASGLHRGAYVVADSPGGPEVVLMATGSEVQWCIDAYAKLVTEKVRARVVSMPSWEVFEQQPQRYREEVLPPEVRARVAVEAASSFGWRRYVGIDGVVVARRDFGASAPLRELLKRFGFTGETVAAEARRLLRGGDGLKRMSFEVWSPHT